MVNRCSVLGVNRVCACVYVCVRILYFAKCLHLNVLQCLSWSFLSVLGHKSTASGRGQTESICTGLESKVHCENCFFSSHIYIYVYIYIYVCIYIYIYIVYIYIYIVIMFFWSSSWNNSKLFLFSINSNSEFFSAAHSHKTKQLMLIQFIDLLQWYGE